MPELLPHHRAELEKSGLDAAVIAAAMFYSESRPAELNRLLNWKAGAERLGPGIVFPFPNSDGSPSGFCQVKPDRPRVSPKNTKDGPKAKPVKYESPKGKPSRVYVPPNARAALIDPTARVIFTEGVKKCVCADAHGLPCLGLVGVDAWSAPRPKGPTGKPTGPRVLNEQLAAVAWAGRPVVILYDSDAATNRDVRRAEWHLAQALTAAGGVVRVARLPAAADGAKLGLDDYLMAKGLDALKGVVAAAEVPAPLEEDGRPVVVIDHEEYRVNQAAAATLASEPDLFQRAGCLVAVGRVGEVAVTDQVKRAPGTAAVHVLPEALVRERMTRAARFARVVGEGEKAKVVAAHPTGWCVKAVFQRVEWDGVRPLVAVLDHPVLLPSGRILTRPGYDPASGLMYSPPPGLEVRVPDRPTDADRDAAVALLLDLVADFPFEAAADRAAWLAAFLTPLAKFAFAGPAPLFLADANVRSAGKGLSCDVIALALTGAEFTVATYTHDEDELRKRITSIAAAGDRLVMLDNLTGKVGNGTLDAALTASRWSDRILGVNKTFNGPLNVVWFASGNNVSFRNDTVRRTIRWRLISPHERPELRTDISRSDLRGYVRECRAELLSAALTILRHYHQSGRPVLVGPPMASFEGWSGLVRQAVVACGMADPVSTQGRLMEDADEDAHLLRCLIAGIEWLDMSRNGVTAAEIARKAASEHQEPDDGFTALVEAVGLICSGKPTSRLIGERLSALQLRNAGGKCITKGRMKNGCQRWTIRTVASAMG